MTGSPLYNFMYAVSCVAATDCTAVGSASDGPPPATVTPAIDRWDGTNWTAETPPPTSGSENYLTSVSCRVGHCVAVGAGLDRVGDTGIIVRT